MFRILFNCSMLSLAMVQCSQYSIFPAFNVQWTIGIQCWHGSTSWTERHLITQCSFLKSMPPTTWFVLFDVLAMSTWLHAYLLLILYSFRITPQSAPLLGLFWILPGFLPGSSIQEAELGRTGGRVGFQWEEHCASSTLRKCNKLLPKVSPKNAQVCGVFGRMEK